MGIPSVAAIKLFFKGWWPLMVAGLVVLILLLTYCEGKRSGRSAADLQREKANVEAMEEQRKADERSARDRVEAARRAEAERSELERTTNEERAKGGNPRDAYYRCIRLQQRERAAGRPAPRC